MDIITVASIVIGGLSTLGVVTLAVALRAEMRLTRELTEDIITLEVAHTSAERENMSLDKKVDRQRAYIKHLETEIVNELGPAGLADLFKRVLQDYPGIDQAD